MEKLKILICGILPPPNFGHSMTYKMLLESSFVTAHDVTFLNLHFWTYGKQNRVTGDKLLKLIKYFTQYLFCLVFKRPQYVLYNMSFYKMPFLKDYLFCITGHLLGAKIIIHDHGQYLPELFANSSPFLQKRITHLLKSTTAIIVMGEKVKKDYKEFFPQERMIVVPGTVEDTHGLDVPLKLRGDAQIKVLYFSFLSVSKGIWTALKAMAIACKANPHIHFTFAGPVESTSLLSEIKKFINDENLASRFDYVGYIESKQERTAYFRGSDIFIFPTHRDVFGLVLLHAMAEGTPTIASREGTIPEIIEDNATGILFEKGREQELATHILNLAADPARRQELSKAARQRFESKYTLEKYGQYMINAFKNIEALPT